MMNNTASQETPGGVLRAEHQVILRVMAVLGRLIERSKAGEGFEVDALNKCVTFFRYFADACHHAKEEDLLFPVLEQRGVPRDGGPIGVMCHEYVLARDIVSRMRDAIASEDVEALRSLTRDCAALLRAHIRKEDQILFPMGRMRLGREDIGFVATRFSEIDADGETHRKYERLAKELREKTACRPREKVRRNSRNPRHE